MATRKTINQAPENRVVIQLSHWVKLVLPMDEGLEMFKLLERAEKYDTDYVDGEHMKLVGGDLENITLEMFSGEEYAKAKMCYALKQKENEA